MTTKNNTLELNSSLLEKQLQYEKENFDYCYDRMMIEINKRLANKNGDELLEGKLLLISVLDIVTDKIVEFFKAPLRGQRKKTRLFLEDFYDRPKDLAYLVLTSIIQEVNSTGYVILPAVIRNIVRNLRQNYFMESLKKSDPKIYSHIEREYKVRGKNYIQSRKIKLGRLKQTTDIEQLNKDTTAIGAELLNIVLKSNIDLIATKTLYKGKMEQNVIVYTERATELILQTRELNIFKYLKNPIFIVPPKDWTTYIGAGGYYTPKLYKYPMIKHRGSNKGLLKDYMARKGCDRYQSILNEIQRTEWRINKRILTVIDKIVKENIVDYNCPKLNRYLIGKLPYCDKQEVSDYINVNDYGELRTEGKHIGTPANRDDYNKWHSACEKQKETIIINRSKAIMLNLGLIDAHKYKDYDKLWFSYNADFRGRIYPLQQHLNPQSKGMIKSLLEFARGSKIANTAQLNWFKIHGANCYGKDKLEYEGRIQFIDDNQELIVSIANDPFAHTGDWKDTDEPFLFLAWCFEYADYLKDPINFESHIPIGIDGTCNGIQIYSGLLLDKAGARAVNVIGETREDIYQVVCDKVNGYLATGDYPKEITFTKADKTVTTCNTEVEMSSSAGHIKRELTKSNVMTQPYSVTSYGMYQQVSEALNTIVDEGRQFWKGDKWVLARGLTTLNSRAILDTVKGAKIGQEFLKDITREVVANNDHIFYKTYIGFPVLQKINKTRVERILTEVGKLSIHHWTDDIHNLKMVNGIAPNFIHSLDSTLMMLTVEKMLDRGCNSFHLIHDSYGVSIQDIENLNICVREAFVELFSSKPLYNFVNKVLPSQIHRVEEVMIDTLDLNDVYKSKYIFS